VIEDKSIEIAGNRLVWRHIQRENQKMILDPLGYDAIKDIDEIHIGTGARPMIPISRQLVKK